MPLPQILRFQAQFAIPLLRRSIRIRTPFVASRSRYFVTTLSQALTPATIESDTNIPVENEESQLLLLKAPPSTSRPTQGPPIRRLIAKPYVPRGIGVEHSKDLKEIFKLPITTNDQLRPKSSASRVVQIDKLMERFRDPTLSLLNIVVIQKVFLKPGIDNPKMSRIFIGQTDLDNEREFISEHGDRGLTPIMEKLRIDNLENDCSRYIILDPNAYGLGLGLEEMDPKMESLSKIEKFYPRQIANNIEAIRRKFNNSKVLIESNIEFFTAFERADAIEMVAKQLGRLQEEYQRTFRFIHDLIFHTPGTGGSRTRLFNSVNHAFEIATANATNILNTSPNQLTLTAKLHSSEENKSTISHEVTSFINNLEIAMGRVEKLIEIFSSGKLDEDIAALRRISRLNKSISKNIESLLATPRNPYVKSFTRLGEDYKPRFDTLHIAYKQVQQSLITVTNTLRRMGYLQKTYPLQEITPRRSLPRITPTIRKTISSPHDTFISQKSPYFARPVDRREYTTGARSINNRKGWKPRRQEQFGMPHKPRPSYRTPSMSRPAPGNSIREKMAAKEKERLEAMEGLGYSLLAKGSKDSSDASVETEVDNDLFQSISAWEGGMDVGGLTDESGVEPLKRGDLCELRGGSSPGLGIYLRPSLGEVTADFLTMSGEITMHQIPRVFFSVPSFIPEESVTKMVEQYDRIAKASGLEGRERSQVVLPRQFMASILDKVRSFANEADRLFAGHKPAFDELHKRLAFQDEESTITLFEATEEIFGDNHGDTHLYATHLALMGDGVRYMADRAAHRATSTFKVRSRDDVSMIEFVTKNIRMVTNQQEKPSRKQASEQKELFDTFNRFIDKARFLIDLSREYKKKDLEAEKKKKRRGPPVQRLAVKDPLWTKDDRCYIDYVKASILRSGTQWVPMDGLVPLILRAVERYEGELDAVTAYQFITEIGAWSAWENLALRQQSSISFPGYGTSKVADEDKELTDKIDSLEAVEKLGLKDILKDIRKDWGQMEVYCIDDASAHEIDDGISLERVNDTENWVHVHIANPTAFLPQNHWLSDVAFRRKQSLYLPETVFPMLPTPLTETVGMGPNRGVMSISAKVNKDGEILDFTLQAGFVRHVKRFTYNDVSEVLGYSDTKPFTLQVGEFPKPIPNRKTSFSEKQIEDLKTLSEIALACRKRRVKSDMIMVNSPTYDVEVYSGLKSPIHPANAPSPNLYRGHPSIKIKVEAHVLRPSQLLVSELMQLANNATAKFCGKNNIAAPFRVQEYDYERKELIDWYKGRLLPSRDALGHAAFETGLRCMMLIGPTRLSASPKPHRLMGFDEGYIRATSPLRRYSDMIAHWQIQSFLLGKPPRTHKQLSSIIVEMDRGERLSNFTAKDSKRFWATAAVARILELGEPKLPEGLTFMVMEKLPFPAMSTGLIVELGIAGKVKYRSKAEELATSAGDILSVVPLVVRPGEKLVWFESKGFAKRAVDMMKAL